MPHLGRKHFFFGAVLEALALFRDGIDRFQNAIEHNDDDYVDKIYEHFWSVEKKRHPNPMYMADQRDMEEEMRAMSGADSDGGDAANKGDAPTMRFTGR